MLRDTTEFSDELKLLIRARFPLVHISTYEEDRAVAIVEAIGAELGKKVVLWSASRGVHGTNKASLDRKDLLDGAWGPFPAATAAALSELGAALALFDSVATHKKRYKAGYLFVLLDPYPYLSGHGVDAIQRRRLRDFVIAIRNGGHHANCLIVSQSLDIPAELEKEISIIDLPLPTRLEIERHISELIEKLRPNKAFKIAGGQELIGRMVDSTVGLTMAEIDNCLARAVVDDLRLDAKDVESIFRQKQQIVRKSGILDHVDSQSLSLEDVGGLDRLKLWLCQRDAAFSAKGRAFGIAPPKGVLVTGVSGCGKSLSAKSVAATWGLPLIHFDIGKVFTSLVGASESRIREAIQVCEAVAPCVLWIDEIEKGLPRTHGYVGDNGTSLRVLATFLTWLQEKESPVFVFATANAIDQLPPEALRKGRFDEIFFVDLPSHVERREIIDIHLRKSGRNPASFDGEHLARITGPEKFGADISLTGAEIASWINESLIAAFQRRTGDAAADLTMADLESTLEGIVPLAKMRQSEIVGMRRWADAHAVHASSPETAKSQSGNMQVHARA